MDRINQLREAFEAAHTNDWATTNVGVAVRMTTHQRPANVPVDWWPDDTYDCVEVLDFTFQSRDRVPVCVYKVNARPWVTGTEQRISFKRALELLAQPLAQSDVHQH